MPIHPRTCHLPRSERSPRPRLLPSNHAITSKTRSTEISSGRPASSRIDSNRSCNAPSSARSATRTGFRCARSVPRTRLTTETEDRIQPGTFAGDQLRRLRPPDPRQRPQGRFQVPGGPPRGSAGPVHRTRSRSGPTAARRTFSASASVCRTARAALGGTCTDRNTHRDQIIRGEPAHLPHPITGARPRVEVRLDVGVVTQVWAAVIPVQRRD